MESIRYLYRIGMGPSSSHTMGPAMAATLFRERYPAAKGFRVTLYGSLAATGRGHLTDKAVIDSLSGYDVEIIWKPEVSLPLHPNGIGFEALDDAGEPIGGWTLYSVGGGALRDDEGEVSQGDANIYPLDSMTALVDWSRRRQLPLWQYVAACEDEDIFTYLGSVWQAMRASIQRGLNARGVLPGPLQLQRKAVSIYERTLAQEGEVADTGLLSAYALAVAEENAAGGIVVTAPTCGSSGVLPAVLAFLQERHGLDKARIIEALAVAGLTGNLVKTRASISGAEVGCQGEIGTACAMAAAAAVYLLGGSSEQVEYAAEMGIEHHLGMTCDPVEGLVQIPCIERNAFAATRAMDCAAYALLSEGGHRISFDDVIAVMKETGRDMQTAYKETSRGGLAAVWRSPRR